MPEPALWSPASPYLYDLTVELLQAGGVTDSYRMKIGIRTIAVEGDRLLLNGTASLSAGALAATRISRSSGAATCRR